MQCKPFRFGPIALTTTTTTNILNPGTTTGGVIPVAAAASTFASSIYVNLFILLRHIRVVNKTTAAAYFGLWLGGTGANAAGTEVIAGAAAAAGALTAGTGVSVPANGVFDWYAGAPGLYLGVADFLVGGAGTATALTIQGEGEVGIV